MTLLGGLLKDRGPIKSEDLWGRWQRGEDLDAPGLTLSGTQVTRDSAMQLSAVWACVSLISDAISTLPLDTFVRRGGVRTPFRPRPAWVLEPNPEQDRQQWVAQQLVALLLEGTAYVLTIRGGDGEVLEAWNVPPWMVTPRRVNRQVVYDVNSPDRGTQRFNRAEMFHVPALSWPGELRGIPPLEAARRVLGAGLGAQEFAERFYGQGVNPSGVVQVPGDMTIEQARELKRDFQNMQGGLRKAHLPAVLTAGASWQQVSVTPEQAQFLETRRFSTAEIARFFRCPPHLIADVERSTSWGTGIEEQNIGFVTYTLRSWLERLEQAYARHMLLFGPAFAKFNVDGLLRGDIGSRYQAYATGRQWGWLSADDVLAREDMPPLPDGQGEMYLVPGNMTPADQAGQQQTNRPGAVSEQPVQWPPASGELETREDDDA